MKILGTGLHGLVGSRISELLSPSYTFENISRSTGVDIANKQQVLTAFEKSDAKVVLHLAAKADVDGCEHDKADGMDGEAWKINVEGTRNIAQACEQFGKKLIYISTDFVFDGEKQSYSEEDDTNPLNWYAQTKYEGEKIVESLRAPWVIARIAYPYRASFSKNDFIRAVKTRLEQAQPVTMVTDHIMTPTFIDDIAVALDTLIDKNANGTFHVVGSEHITPYDAAVAIAKAFDYNQSLIGKTTRKEFFQGRAPRPFRLALKNDKIQQQGVSMHTLHLGLEKLKQQL